ncbi:GntR family transcriptional regulator [Nocardioides sp.]|uniref:GntR family transcriptional regulator n=1 Tax=Nocardioides sp. TaxID=35761 RepID=UPI0035B070D8
MSNPRTESTEVMRAFVIDRSSPVPLYFQVGQQLEEAIAEGRIPPGTLLLNEVELSDVLNLSRPTMRRAIQSLVDKGLLVRRRGVGTRVVQPMLRRSLELTSLYDDLSRTGRTPATKVLSFALVSATDDVADRLGVSPDDEILQLVRLRSAGDMPIAKMTNYIPADLVRFTQDDLVSRGLYDLIRAQGITLHSATQAIGARTALVEESKLLGEPKGAALLTMERTTYDDHGRIVEFGTHVYAASRYSFETSLLTG